jgi:hypothetical protein
VAERLAAGARGPAVGAPGIASVGDIAGFVAPLEQTAEPTAVAAQLRVDPFDDRGSGRIPVASGQRAPTVSARVGGARQLTAILIADDRPVAVIDGAVVNVGDVLPDGGRVAAIRADRVAIAERNGQMRVLTIPTGRR